MTEYLDARLELKVIEKSGWGSPIMKKYSFEDGSLLTNLNNRAN